MAEDFLQGPSCLVQHWSSHSDMRATAGCTPDMLNDTGSIPMSGQGHAESVRSAGISKQPSQKCLTLGDEETDVNLLPNQFVLLVPPVILRYPAPYDE
jgi:hypothetical protein